MKVRVTNIEKKKKIIDTLKKQTKLNKETNSISYLKTNINKKKYEQKLLGGKKRTNLKKYHVINILATQLEKSILEVATTKSW